MALAERLATSKPKPKTTADHYDAWLEGLPRTEQDAVLNALRDQAWTHKDLKRVLETDDDNPAPIYGITAFGRWRNEKVA